MNTKPLLCFTCLFAVTLAASTVYAGPNRRGGNRFVSRSARGAIAGPFAGGGNRIGAWNGQRFNGQRFISNRNWNGQHWNHNHWSNNWNWHHHHHFRDFVFLDFGFPFWGWWGYPWYYGNYPYGYPYGYYGYGSGYYGNSGYPNSNGYATGSNVADLQRKLADAGYYHGPIDGIMGSRTRYALRAYRHDHSNGNNNGGYSPTLRDRPYSPPPITTEPSPSDE